MPVKTLKTLSTAPPVAPIYSLLKVGWTPLVHSESGVYRRALVENRTQRNERRPPAILQ